MITHKISVKRSLRVVSAALAAWMLFTVLSAAMSFTAVAADRLETSGGTNSYALFNSGCSSSSGMSYSSSQGVDANPNSSSYSNSGYDIYGQMNQRSTLTLKMGLSFHVNTAVTERATLTVYAYDVDEESGETDLVYLVDETTGSRVQVGKLSGMNDRWNTTTLHISNTLFTVGHTYHFENTISNPSGSPSPNAVWWVYIRRVSIELTTSGSSVVDPVRPTITDHSFTAQIGSNGTVSTTLYVKTNQTVTYTLEYAASISGNQKGEAQNQTITATSSGATKQVSFALESGSPTGTYQIDVVLKDSSGNTVTAYTTSAGYSYRAVSYHANGGSNNLPTDASAYSAGDTVTVLFDYVPSKSGYVFLGWATSSTATTPQYTQNGTKTFVMGNADVHLYAVWAEQSSSPVTPPSSHTHTESEWIRDTAPTCDQNGSRHTECTECHVVMCSEAIAALGHDYQIVSTVEPTCTQDGYLLLRCAHGTQNDFVCRAEKRQTLSAAGHQFGDDQICDVCQFRIPDAHTHEFRVQTVAATCTQMGYTLHQCNCGYSYRSDYIDQRGHRWNDGEFTKNRTCTADGVLQYTCTECAASYTEIIPACHKWVEIEVIEETCTEDGQITRACMDCTTREVVVIPAAHKWNEGTVIKAATCVKSGSKLCKCTVCGHSETQDVDPLGHQFVNGVCIRCREKFIGIVSPDEDHPEYGMYFEIDDIISNYGPDYINEYGVLLDYNSGATLEKVAVYLTQDGTMWRRCIACVGENITYATYVPYLSYDEDIKYTGLNSDWINIFRLEENADGVWCYSDYTTIGVNLEDRNGNLLLSLYDIGQAGAKTRVFDDLDEMIAWLTDSPVTPDDPDDTCECEEGAWTIVTDATCTQEGLRYVSCAKCGQKMREEAIPTLAHEGGEWIVVIAPTVTASGLKQQKCVKCQQVIGTEMIPVLAQLTVSDVCTEAGATVTVTVDIQNNPGILGAILTLTYDPALTLIDARAGSAWSTLTLTMPNDWNSSCRFVWDGIQGADMNDGTVLILTFRVSDQAPANSALAVEISFTEGNVIDSSLQNVELAVKNGTVTTVDELSGDINNDGVVNVADIVTLRRYLAGGYSVTIEEQQADMNGDGSVTVADVVLLRRLIVGDH